MKKTHSLLTKILSFVVSTTVFLTSNTPIAYSDTSIILPKVGSMIELSQQKITPLLFNGIKVYQNKPFQFDFILNQTKTATSVDEIKNQSLQMAKYFLSALAVPESDLWVNLSPYEKDNIIAPVLGETTLGKALLEEDYILKQLSASVLHPEKELGREFWQKVYNEAKNKLGTTQIPVNTFNKIWILPDTASVYQTTNAAYITEAKLKVMMDTDYLATTKNIPVKSTTTANLSDTIYRDLILPKIQEEVNNGEHFAALRQVYHSLILAKWYKEQVKNSLINKAYSNKNKINGVDISDTNLKEKLYAQYIEAYKKGVFNLVKEDGVIGRKYFAGGLKFAIKLKDDPNRPYDLGKPVLIVGIKANPNDRAMATAEVNRIGLKIKTPKTRDDLIDDLKAAFGKNKNGEWRDIKVTTDDPTTHKLLEEFGFEQDPNKLTLVRALLKLTLSNATIKPITTDGTRVKFNTFIIVFTGKQNVKGHKNLKVHVKNSMTLAEFNAYLVKENEDKMQILLPESSWFLPKENVGTLASILGVEKNNVYYRGKANDLRMQEAQEAARLAEEKRLYAVEEAEKRAEEEARVLAEQNRLRLAIEALRQEELARQKARLDKIKKWSTWIGVTVGGVLVAIGLAAAINEFLPYKNKFVKPNFTQTSISNSFQTPQVNKVIEDYHQSYHWLEGMELNQPLFVDDIKVGPGKVVLEKSGIKLYPLPTINDVKTFVNLTFLLSRDNAGDLAHQGMTYRFVNAELFENFLKTMHRDLIIKQGEEYAQALIQILRNGNPDQNFKEFILATLAIWQQTNQAIKYDTDIQQMIQAVIQERGYKSLGELAASNIKNIYERLVSLNGQINFNTPQMDNVARFAIQHFDSPILQEQVYAERILGLMMNPQNPSLLVTQWQLDEMSRAAQIGDQFRQVRLAKLDLLSMQQVEAIPTVNQSKELTSLLRFYNSPTWEPLLDLFGDKFMVAPNLREEMKLSPEKFDIAEFKDPTLAKFAYHQIIEGSKGDLIISLAQREFAHPNKIRVFIASLQYALILNADPSLFDVMRQDLLNPNLDAKTKMTIMTFFNLKIEVGLRDNDPTIIDFVKKYSKSLPYGFKAYAESNTDLNGPTLELFDVILTAIYQSNPGILKSDIFNSFRKVVETYQPLDELEKRHKESILKLLSGQPIDQAMVYGGIDLSSLKINNLIEQNTIVEAVSNDLFAFMINQSSFSGLTPEVISIKTINSAAPLF